MSAWMSINNKGSNITKDIILEDNNKIINDQPFVLKIYYILPLITNKYYRNNRIIMIRAFHYLKYFSVKSPPNFIEN
jgi:hypothetical protein